MVGSALLITLFPKSSAVIDSLISRLSVVSKLSNIYVISFFYNRKEQIAWSKKGCLKRI